MTEFSGEVKRVPGGDGRVQFGMALAQDLQGRLALKTGFDLVDFTNNPNEFRPQFSPPDRDPSWYTAPHCSTVTRQSHGHRRDTENIEKEDGLEKMLAAP